MTEVGVGLYGSNGHQLGQDLYNISGARLAACCQVKNPPDGIPLYQTLPELLADPRVDLVSICSPIRADQAEDIRLALRCGKHVYAEKPCVLAISDLDSVIQLSKEMGCGFFEMAGTAFEEPYATTREIVNSGELGTIIQVLVQKSYPYGDWRPQDEKVDGGLILQVGIHAVRMIEHVAMQKVVGVSAIETRLGNPKQGDLRMASSLNMQLEGGAIASANLNYLNQPGYGNWAYEKLRIFGTNAFLSTDFKNQEVFLSDNEGNKEIRCKDRIPYFQQVINYLLGISERPLEISKETHPTRVVIRAKASANQRGRFLTL